MRSAEPPRLGPEELEALRRVSAAGAENAGLAISVLTGLNVRCSEPSVRSLQVDEVPALLGGDEAAVVAMHMAVTGGSPSDPRGSILIALAPDCAGRLLDALCPGRTQGPPPYAPYAYGRGLAAPTDLSEMERSGLLETGNILAAAYLTAVSDKTRLNFVPSVPHLAVDMAGALIDYLVVELNEGRDSALLIDTRMQDASGELSARILMLPDPATLPDVLQALRQRGM